MSIKLKLKIILIKILLYFKIILIKYFNIVFISRNFIFILKKCYFSYKFFLIFIIEYNRSIDQFFYLNISSIIDYIISYHRLDYIIKINNYNNI